MKCDMFRGSYLPVLMKVVSLTSGPVLELGCGHFSTPYLHWSCYPTRRRLVTYESHRLWYDLLLSGVARNRRNHQTSFHEVHYTSDWDSVDLSEAWSVAFVDHSHGCSEPSNKQNWRYLEILRLQHAEYVVVHDTERKFRRKYLWDLAFPKFRYRFQFTGARPETTVLSNTHDLSRFTVP